MLLRWMPYKYIIRRLARSHGLLDPMKLFSRFSRFAQPSEVAVPIELLRSSLVLHARGILNARTIQSNLDWLWPYWVQRQFNPMDPGFIPRSLTVSHVNLSNRNWTAVGLPDCRAYPIVDPRGMVTPFFDGWSLDGWVLNRSGGRLLPPKCPTADQRLRMEADTLAVETALAQDGLRLESRVDVALDGRKPVCRIRYRAEADTTGCFVVALRPFNPEGVSFIDDLVLEDDGKGWRVNGVGCLAFSRRMERHLASTYPEGDVFLNLLERTDRDRADCEVGMVSAAAVYELEAGAPLELSVSVDLEADPETRTLFPVKTGGATWTAALDGAARLRVPDARVQEIYDAAVRSIVLHAPLEVYPGPFYYRRFWYRDAVFILHALLCIGLHDRARRILDAFPSRQTMAGYYRSQEGEWDSNGQVAWIMKRFADLTGMPLGEDLLNSLSRGCDWIRQKRLPSTTTALHAGLLPAGFSAEHFGNNDYYYWDDLWGIAGLSAAADVFDRHGRQRKAERFRSEAEDFEAAVEKSLKRSRSIRRHDGLPASPYRRMDSGAVGSIVGGYPLQLWSPSDPRLLGTVDYLLRNCFIEDAFFQDMTHSGLNVYLSLHCAQVLLRAGDERFLPIVRRAVELASPTGQWPEAIHPQTLAGCMGDGQHIWAAADWVMMLRNMFVREEGDGLVLLQGVPREWLRGSGPAEMGPVHTPFGPVTVRAFESGGKASVLWSADWRTPPARMRLALPGAAPVDLAPEEEGRVVVPITG